jgi:hypothetical protein
VGIKLEMESMMSRPEISRVSPVFIVQDFTMALSFYRDQLGFEVTFQQPAENPFFGIVQRGGAMIMLKSVGVDPLPNCKRHPWVHSCASLNPALARLIVKVGPKQLGIATF